MSIRPLVAALALALSHLPVPAIAQATAPLKKVTIGTIPVPDLVVLYLGVEKGYFAKRGLELDIVGVPGSQAAVSALVSEAIQFGIVDLVSGAIAQEKGVPVRWITTIHSNPSDAGMLFTGTFARPDAGIRTWADLAGKKVQVSCRKCGSELYLRAAIDRNGGDSSKVQMIVMPTADAVPALKQGNLDAMMANPGLVPIAQKEGFVLVGDHVAQTALGHPLGPIALNKTWADANVETVNAFVGGVEEAVAYAAAHPLEARKLLPKYYKLQVPDEAAAQKVPLATWTACFGLPAVKTMLDYAHRYRFVDKPVADPKSLFYANGAVQARACNSN
jgi:NitT/TauT family transport system substrate-binding protein